MNIQCVQLFDRLLSIWQAAVGLRISDQFLTAPNNFSCLSQVELRWWKKDADGAGTAERELTFSNTGRKARIDGQVQQIAARPAWLETKGVALRTETYETARMRHSGYDIYFVEGEWRAWAAGKEAPRDPDRAFLAFFRSFAENNPLAK